MKVLVEIIGGIVVGAVAALTLHLIETDIPPVESIIIVMSIVVSMVVVSEFTGRINKRIDEKKRAETEKG